MAIESDRGWFWRISHRWQACAMASSTEPRQAVAKSLEEAGFWSQLPAAQQKSRQQEFVDGTPPDLTVEELGWWADGENLAEGDVETLLSQMSEAISARGVTLEVETTEGPHDLGSNGYSIRINGVDLDLYRYDPDSELLPLSEDPWTDCTVFPLARVNELLEGAGSSDRVVVFRPGGNDGFVLLLTHALIATVEDNRSWFDNFIVPS
jgi:hypothetical protein